MFLTEFSRRNFFKAKTDPQCLSQMKDFEINAFNSISTIIGSTDKFRKHNKYFMANNDTIIKFKLHLRASRSQTKI